jgi:hypothetical protein
MFTTAFDVALTEFLVWEHGAIMREPKNPQRDATLSVANARMLDKYTHCVGDDDTASLRDLRLLSDLRDELVHFLPRSPRTKENVPHWFKPLHKRGLFIETKRDSDFSLAQKLASYALGYWAAEVIDRSAQALRSKASPMGSIYADCLCSNFELYRYLDSPDALGEYDALHGLTLTPVVP